jgi:hypothetical protein
VPYKYGGALTFDFDFPIYFQDIGLMNVVDAPASLELTYADDFIESFGPNSVQRVLVDKANVIRLKVMFGQGIVAISEINFCAQCMAKITNLDNRKCNFAEKTLTNGVEFIEIDDFESESSEPAAHGWKNGKVIYDGLSNFTNYLGLENQTSDSLYKVFSVPKNAADVFFDMEFYRIGNWETQDTVVIYVDGEKISITQGLEPNSTVWNGSTTLGIAWNATRFHSSSNVGFLSHTYQRYRFKIQVPARSQLYFDGSLRLLLRTRSKEGSILGWDNIKLSARYNCETLNSTSILTPKTSTMITPTRKPTLYATPSTNPPLKFPSSSPIVPPTPQPVKSTIIEPLPAVLQITTNLATGTPAIKLSTPITTKIQSNVLKNIFSIRTPTKKPAAKRP